MGAKTSAEVKYGVELVMQGLSIAESARIAGVQWSSIKRAMIRMGKKAKKSRKDSP